MLVTKLAFHKAPYVDFLLKSILTTSQRRTLDSGSGVLLHLDFSTQVEDICTMLAATEATLPR